MLYDYIWHYYFNNLTNMRIRLIISYDGTDFFGYQIQKNSRTIQLCIEEVIKKVYNTNVKTINASRTDTGVHANCQNVVFDIPSSISRIPVENLKFVFNKELPEDIRVIKSMEVCENFHPRYDSIKKTYSYTIYNGENMPPYFRRHMTCIKKELDLDAIKEAMTYFVGTYDFVGFSNTGSSVKSTIRTIYDFEINSSLNVIKLSITGNGFLYNMVRIIVGTLIFVGHGKIKPSEIPEIILSKDRNLAGKTASPNGLVLEKIYYEVEDE